MAVGAIIAAAVAVAGLIANEVRSSNAASDAEDENEKQRRLAEEDAQRQAQIQLAEKYAGRSLPGTRLNNQRDMIERGYQGAKENIGKQRDAQSSANWTNAGTSLVNIGMSQIGNMDGWGGGGGQDQAFQGFDNDSLGQRAGQMNLNASDYGLLNGGILNAQQPAIRTADPNGGFNLQQDDYSLLSGNDPTKYRFRL